MSTRPGRFTQRPTEQFGDGLRSVDGVRSAQRACRADYTQDHAIPVATPRPDPGNF